MKLFVIAALLLSGAACQAQTMATVEAKNPGFEGVYKAVNSSSDAPTQKARIVGQIAEGWEDNSNWADVAIEYSKDTANAHRGQLAQRVAVSRVAGGAAQLVQPVAFQKGHILEFRVWLRGQAGTSVTLALRQAGTPYTNYAERAFSVSAEWAEYRVAGVAGDDTAGFAMIIARSPATFEADDAQLRDLAQASTNAAPKTGNLISGGSFEAGLSFGWSTRYEGPMRHAFADPRPRVDNTIAATGRQSLRNDIPEGDNASIRSPLFTYNFGRAHAISAWLKASAPNTRVEIGVEGTDISTAVQVGTSWQRFTLNGTLPFRDYARLRFYCAAPEGGSGVTLWIDGAQVEERAAPSATYLAAAPLELTLNLPRPGKIVFDGEAHRVLVGIAPQVPQGARLQLSMQNVYGVQRVLPSIKLPAGSFALPVFAGRERGVFKLRGVVVDAKGSALSSPVEMVWARLPRPRNIAPEKSFFGLHIPLSPEFIAIARATGQRRVRLHDTSMIAKWAIAEATPGCFEFFDEGITAAHSAGLSVLGMLDGAPPRATTKPREGGYWNLWNIPDALDALVQWRNYVRTVTSHYKGRIDDWEVWNEPWGSWWLASGNPHATPELYGQILRAASEEAKAANANAQIIGIDTMRGYDESWTKPALKAAGLQAFDAFSFHDYNDAFYGGPKDIAQAQAQTFTALMREQGTPRPLWNTEGGPGQIASFYASQTGGLGIELQGAWAVRFDVTHMAAGTRNFFLYAMPTDPAMGETDFRADEFDRAIKPIIAARAVLAWLVDGAGIPTRTEPVKGVDCYTFPRLGSQTVSVLWSYDGVTHSLQVPNGVRVLDVWGNTTKATRGQGATGIEPIYFVR